MSDPNGEPDGKAVAADVPSGQADGASDHAASSDAALFHDDLQASQTLAEILAAGGGDGSAMDDLHAALASIPEDTYLSLDDAAHHLTTSVDLFDVPVVHSGDASDHSS